MDVPGEALSRRRFFQAVIGLLSALTGLVLSVPFISVIVGSSLKRNAARKTRVAAVSSLPLGEPVDLKFPDVTMDAFINMRTMGSVWAVKRSPTEVVVYSPICPHLGCEFNWDRDKRRFACPCHGSVWTIDGTVVQGPAPRPLDTLPAEIREGELYVEIVRYRLGVPQKTEV